MSPRLRQITEERSRDAIAWCLAWLVVAVHAAFFAVHQFCADSFWSAPLAGIAYSAFRTSWAAFKKAETHFAALEAVHPFPSGRLETTGRPYSKPNAAGGQRPNP